jgi:metal-sulfur cluster biosynthetic enzyme
MGAGRDGRKEAPLRLCAAYLSAAWGQLTRSRAALLDWPGTSGGGLPMTTAVTETMVLDALRKVIDPELHHDVVELGFIQEVEILGDYVHLDVQLTTPYCPFAESIVQQMKDAVAGVRGVKKVEIERACMKED